MSTPFDDAIGGIFIFFGLCLLAALIGIACFLGWIATKFGLSFWLGPIAVVVAVVALFVWGKVKAWRVARTAKAGS